MFPPRDDYKWKSTEYENSASEQLDEAVTNFKKAVCDTYKEFFDMIAEKIHDIFVTSHDHETHFTETIEERDNVQLADCHKRYTDAPEIVKDSESEVMNQ